MTLQQKLSELDETQNRHKRGSLFEELVAGVLEEQGFDVTLNAKVATPRQTDLYAHRDGLSFIVEAKWQKKTIHIGNIEPIVERLRKTPPDVFACVFSMSGYTQQAVKYASENRSHEVLLFNEDEIRGMVADELSFTKILNRKKDEIRRNARVWFADWKPRSWRAGLLPAGPETLRIGSQSANWWRCETHDNDVLFSRELLDLGGDFGAPVSLRLRADVRTSTDLLRLLRILKIEAGLKGEESFAIHQGPVGWYGSGKENFAAAIGQWNQRYAELNWSSYHHSEELAYCDRLEDGGLMGITLRQRVGEGAYLYSCEIEILMSGLPVDPSKLRALCEQTGNNEARFEFEKHKAIYTHRFHPRVPVHPVGLVVDPAQGELASGLITKNPFYEGDTRSSLDALSLSSSNPLRFLTNNELLFCRLKSWHPATKMMDRYSLVQVDGCWIANIPVLYVACDWE